MSVDTGKLETVYEQLLGIVKREVNRFAETEALEDKEIRSLSELDKVLRSALEYYGSKSKTSTFDAKSTDDLLKDFD